MPATGLKIVGMGPCSPWCSISASFQNSLKTFWASILWVSGVLVLKFGPILAWNRFPATKISNSTGKWRTFPGTLFFGGLPKVVFFQLYYLFYIQIGAVVNIQTNILFKYSDDTVVLSLLKQGHRAWAHFELFFGLVWDFLFTNELVWDFLSPKLKYMPYRID